MKQQRALTRSALTMTSVLLLAGCGTSGPADVSGLRGIVGSELAGARGATQADQRKIDRTVVGLCAASVWTRRNARNTGRAEMIDAGVHQQLGTLVAEVKNLREDLRRSEDRSDVGRVSMTRRMDELVERMRTLEGSMMLVKDDIAAMKPVTEDVRKWKLMGMGALGVIGIGGAALGVTFADVAKRVLMLTRAG